VPIKAAPDPLPTEELGALNPNPVVLLCPDGNIVWKNRAAHDFDLASWPAGSSSETAPALRAPLTRTDGDVQWFRFSRTSVKDHQAVFAIPADGEVKAEDSRKEFVQTLSKTFAQLSTALAIFDRSRRLVLFNPALLDMAQTTFDVLSQRPTLASFLDTLRTNGVVPEPRNYAEWRDKVSQLESEAVAGCYSECWSLPSGQTFRLTGRPHPDGAIALLIEDISSEVGASRQFNRELARYRDVIDVFEVPFIVFSSEGKAVLENTAYRRLWGLPEDVELTGQTVADSTTAWSTTANPDPVWGEIRNFVAQRSERAVWDARTIGPTGSDLTVRVSPLPQCRTLVEFTSARSPAKLALHTAAE